jgi:hypothetical protein
VWEAREGCRGRLLISVGESFGVRELLLEREARLRYCTRSKVQDTESARAAIAF